MRNDKEAWFDPIIDLIYDYLDILDEVEDTKMEMTNNNLCNSCTNIGCNNQSGIVRTECVFYMPPHLEPDNCGNYVIMQPTVEAIPKEEVRQFIESIQKIKDNHNEYGEPINYGTICDILIEGYRLLDKYRGGKDGNID